VNATGQLNRMLLEEIKSVSKPH